MTFTAAFIVGRLFLTPYFVKIPPPLLWTPVFPNFVSLLCGHHQPPPPLLFLLSCFFGWMGYCATFDVLLYVTSCNYWSTHVKPCYRVVPKRACCVLCNKVYIKFTEVWHIMCFFLLCWYSNLISCTHKHKHTLKHLSHSEANRLTHSYKCIINKK